MHAGSEVKIVGNIIIPNSNWKPKLWQMKTFKHLNVKEENHFESNQSKVREITETCARDEFFGKNHFVEGFVFKLN